MRDKTEQIYNAAIEVFIKKGFAQATTLEIANVANVAEVTLFRKFKSKQNLFILVIKNVLEKQFNSRMLKLAEGEDTEHFLNEVIENRLEILSKNKKLVKMLISESLNGNLTEDINLPNVIFNSLKIGLEHHFKKINKEVDIELCARHLGGIFLSYIILPNDQDFYSLSKDEKEILINKYTKSVMSLF